MINPHHGLPSVISVDSVLNEGHGSPLRFLNSELERFVEDDVVVPGNPWLNLSVWMTRCHRLWLRRCRSGKYAGYHRYFAPPMLTKCFSV